jgi:hypothetical protein
VHSSLGHISSQDRQVTCEGHPLLLRFGYLVKWFPCVCESLNTKGEMFDPHAITLCSNFTLTLFT